MAKWLEGVLPDIVEDDQNGFANGIQVFHNARCVLNVLHAQKGEKDMALLLLDAEAAFNRVEWTHVFDAIAWFGFGDTFCNWIKINLNAIPEVLTNEVVPLNIKEDALKVQLYHCFCLFWL